MIEIAEGSESDCRRGVMLQATRLGIRLGLGGVRLGRGRGRRRHSLLLALNSDRHHV
jgi:hypothetical protein